MIDPGAVVDENGDIILHGRQGAKIPIEFRDAAGNLRNMIGASVMFECGPTMNIPLVATGGAIMELTLTNADVKTIYNMKDRRFVVMETINGIPTPVWQGMVYVEGWIE
jgi:hypothetical protein